ncbi:MAG: 50S ribosomal protein L17 [Rickettsiales bacterium]
MKHNIKLKKLNRTSAHRKALFANMVASIIKHAQIKTTLAKAKVVRPIVERLITKAKVNTVASRRYLLSKINDTVAVEKLLAEVGPENMSRAGGYIRIIKAGFRTGDAAPMAVVELVEKSKKAKAKTPSESKSKTTSEQKKDSEKKAQVKKAS